MCLSPISIVNPRYKGNNYFEHRGEAWLASIGAMPYMDYTLRVPCGKCVECLSRRRADLAFRVIYEMEKSYHPVFVTLTYDNEHLPQDGSLSKDDAKKFIKYCHNHLPFDFKYYLCGEYGDLRGRPHLHACLMPSEDSDFDWSSFLASAWDKGIVDVLPLNPERCAYCCKYSVKQLGVDYSGKQSPFHLFSKSLGIGFVKCDDSDDLTDIALQIVSSGKLEFDGHRISRYYAEKLFDKTTLRILGQKSLDEYLDYLDGVVSDCEMGRGLFLRSRLIDKSERVRNLEERRPYLR